MLLEARDLTKQYALRRLFGGTVISRALNNVDFQIETGSVTALAGASGSGKSTLSRCLAGLESPTRGVVSYRGTDMIGLSKPDRLDFRRNVQIVFQHAAASINPRFTAAAAIAEPLRISRKGDEHEQTQLAMYWMEQVGLSATAAKKPALELSGGERQRLSIARALISVPQAIIFDEAFSALDLPLTSRILGLLDRLRVSYGFTYLFVGHDLTLLSRICTTVAVMYGGRIVERESMNHFLSVPAHAYSRELVRAVPRILESRCL
jgi:ABC-type dipeptide/oligopeptide/nickel transport system ATPase subunit